MLLLPVIEDSHKGISWKIWILSTRLESFDLQAEDENLLQSPRKVFDNVEEFETDVFMIGGGNA